MRHHRDLAAVLVILTILVLSSSASAQPLQWRMLNPGFWMNLYSVFPLTADNAWVVGQSGTILHWDGAGCRCWSFVASPTTLDLYSVIFPDAANPNDGWAVGQFDPVSGLPVVLHWDGIAWVLVDTTNGLSWLPGQVGTLYGLFFLTPSDGWAVGVGTTTQPGVVTNIVHWSGSWGAGGSWTIKATPAAALPFDLYSVHVLSNTATPVGGYAVGGNPGVAMILFWDGANWNQYLGAVPAAILRSVWMISSTDAWAVGDWAGVGGPAAIRLAGTTWGGPMSISALGVSNLYSVVATDTDHAWAVGLFGATTNIINWVTPAWGALTTPILADLYSIRQDATGSDFWAVGAGGTIMRSMDGSSWTSWSSPVGPWSMFPFSPHLYSIFMRTVGDTWAVGQSGVIIHWDENSWSSYITSPTTNDLLSVHTTSDTSGWAVGAAGTILTLSSGPAWSVVASGATVTLRGVFVLQNGEAWAVGDAPNPGLPATILHWTPPAGPWAAEASNTPVGTNLRSIYMLSDGSEGWAVGELGGAAVIDHYYASCGGGGPCWTAAFGPPIPANVATLNSVFIANDNPGDVWAVGDVDPLGFASAIHYDGTMWSRVAIENAVTGAFNLNTVCMVPGSSTDGWTMGNSFWNGATWNTWTFHWDGVTWNAVLMQSSSLFPLDINSASFLAAEDGWAAGDFGMLVHWGTGIDIEIASTTSTTTTSATSSLATGSATSTLNTETSSLTTVSTESSTSSSEMTSGITTWTGPAETNTAMPLPLPGFPLEAIIAGLVLGASIPILRRRSRSRRR